MAFGDSGTGGSSSKGPRCSLVTPKERLSQAAPDLLKALKAMVLNAPMHRDCMNSLPVAQAKAAIAKAEGTK